MDNLFSKVKSFGDDAKDFFKGDLHSHTHYGHSCHGLHATADNTYHSFAPPRSGNQAKYYIDGANYFHAVSVALEQAKTSIWIMDWWLSPELYLRRPPSKNENYRLDRMLKAAAERGVMINVMIYKEVPNVLTTCSEHSKHALETLHPNIAVFRHPDHNPSGRALASGFVSAFKSMSFGAKNLAQLGETGLEALYGFSDDVVLFWAHHEKLCLIDGRVCFMGGLDLCFGRWDTHQHETADAHPADINETIWPGQDFNNGRIMDFQDVTNYDRNKLDRTKDVRMGWSDLSLCLEGPVTEDFRAHFVARWNWIYEQKYVTADGGRYKLLTMTLDGEESDYYHENGQNRHIKSLTDRIMGPGGDDDASDASDAEDKVQAGEHHIFRHADGTSYLDDVEKTFHHGVNRVSKLVRGEPGVPRGLDIQMVRSAARWSHGIPVEHSIANAYIDVITNAQHFVYIENQFFITATDDKQEPVKNKIGAAIAERIVKAHEANERFKVIVCMPAVPGFAGDLHAEESAGTLAIMNYQYRSINRGGHSIIDKLEAAGIENTSQYIQFFNLRNYDRINAGATMAKAEDESGISYETARKEHDDLVGAGYDGRGEGTAAQLGSAPALDQYQHATPSSSPIADSVAACYMLNGPSLTSVSWSGSAEDEMAAFVSEELYIHSKVLIADDRVVICGSANLNDRSQLGNHDSEMAVVITASDFMPSSMNGQPYSVSRFAAGLRRQLFRKHLGLLECQDVDNLGVDGMPVGHGSDTYDWDSASDVLVKDPLSTAFEQLWRGRARKNTDIFQRVFSPVPCDAVRNWAQYQELYGKLFVSESASGTPKEEALPPKYKYGHVVTENFRDVRAMKEVLGEVRGMLVEMPLDFLIDEKEMVRIGLSVNDITDEIYT